MSDRPQRMLLPQFGVILLHEPCKHVESSPIFKRKWLKPFHLSVDKNTTWKKKNHPCVLVSGTVVSYMFMNVKLWLSRKELQAFTRALNRCLEIESAIPWCYCMDDLCHSHCLYWLYGRVSHGDNSALCRVCVCGCMLHPPVSVCSSFHHGVLSSLPRLGWQKQWPWS